MIFPGEVEAIKAVLAHGEQFGYGNLISHLQTAWARKLIDEYGMSEQSARGAASGGSGYPIEWQKSLLGEERKP